jgi:O-methyltransferase domain
MTDDAQDATLRLMTILGNFYLIPIIHAAAKIGLAERVRNAPQTIESIARETGCLAPQLRRLVRALVAVDILTMTDESTVALGRLGLPLVSGTAGSISELARLIGEPFFWTPWAFLHRSLETGRSAFAEAHGEPFFEYLFTHTNAAELFDSWMTQSSHLQTWGLLPALDLIACTTIADIGGGQGELLRAILQSNQGEKAFSTTCLPSLHAPKRARLRDSRAAWSFSQAIFLSQFRQVPTCTF